MSLYDIRLRAMSSVPTALSSVVGAIAFLAFTSQPLLPQGSTAVTEFPTKVVATSFDGDVRDLPKIAAPTSNGAGTLSFPLRRPPSNKPEAPTPQSSSSAMETVRSLAPAPSPSANFAGLAFNQAVTGGQAGAGYPPDTNGDVGRNHYIQAVNSSYGIYNKAGTLLAAFTENSLFAGSGNICATASQGDPVALYDTLADRWILTHFAFNVDGSGNPVTPFFQCFAASKTNDPVTGGWWLYAVRMDPGGAGLPPVGSLNDYPKFGIWPDCLYMSANEFLAPGFAFSGTLFASLSKSDMYAGLPLTLAIGVFPATGPASMVPSHLSGNAAGAIPPAGTPNYFVSETQTAGFFYEVRRFTAGANCGAGGSLAAAVNVSQVAYAFAAGAIIPQPGTTQRLDNVDDRIMQRTQYRKVGATESLWVTHNVNRAPAAMQWAQINVTGGTIAAAPVQEQIYSPDAILHRWMGSIAADSQGNVALGYSTSGTTAPNFPSIAYSGRLASDPLNTLPQSEVQLIAGTGSQVGPFSAGNNERWGDYTAMVVDPSDDCTFWYTNEYYTAASSAVNSWLTRVGAFKYPTCVATAAVSVFTKTHMGNFAQGQVGATYTITVSNTGTAIIPGPFTVSDAVPAGLTATAIGGTGWTCTQPAGPCSRTNSLEFLANGASFPPITLTVNVSAAAPATVTNVATLLAPGFSAAPLTASDPTIITPVTAPVADMTIIKTHAGNFSQGQVGATYTITVTNSGTGPTVGIVTVTETVPAGLTATAIAGVGWTCTQPAGPCTRTDVLAAGASYPAITLTVNVAANAPVAVTNTANVAGGGETNTGNNTAADPTTILVAVIPPDAFIIRYAANLTAGDSVIDITNTGANGASLTGPGFGGAVGNICVNVYAFSPDEQLVSCCSCLITPNGLVSLSVNQDMVSNTLTGVRPNSIVVKLLNTGAAANFAGTNCTNSAALAGTPAFPLAGGVLAFGTTLHAGPAAGAFNLTETPFIRATLSPAELASITSRCTNIVGNGSSFGICRSCRAGGLNTTR